MEDRIREYSFAELAQSVEQVHDVTSACAKGAVNQLLTIRNWAIGCYIVEYEQNGRDRAKYGAHLLKSLEEKVGIKGLSDRAFYRCRMFYLKFPDLLPLISERLNSLVASAPMPLLPEIGEEKTDIETLTISPTALAKFKIDPDTLISKLSFAHISEIMSLDDPFERFFYEFECIKCGWSVRELHRQIVTNLYFRAGYSKNPEKLLAETTDTTSKTALTVKEPYALEFLGLDAKESVSESDLEQALMDHLQEFMLELGKGFCFEARQKRIIIDDQYCFADMVFYNRLLHCSVTVELKNDEFKHEYLGQLNAYVAYYKEQEMSDRDNPPVGILLCTKKGPKMVEYALSGMDNQLFVSTYMLHLPDREQLESFMLREIDELEQD